MTVIDTPTFVPTVFEVDVPTLTDEEIASVTYPGPVNFDRIDHYIGWAESQSILPVRMREWDQEHWHQDANWMRVETFCIAGKIGDDLGYSFSEWGMCAGGQHYCPAEVGMEYLGLSENKMGLSFLTMLFGDTHDEQGRMLHTNLFHGHNTVEDLKAIRDIIADGEGYPRRYHAPEAQLLHVG